MIVCVCARARVSLNLYGIAAGAQVALLFMRPARKLLMEITILAGRFLRQLNTAAMEAGTDPHATAAVLGTPARLSPLTAAPVCERSRCVRVGAWTRRQRRNHWMHCLCAKVCRCRGWCGCCRGPRSCIHRPVSSVR
jgi:hypothetical protein